MRTGILIGLLALVPAQGIAAKAVPRRLRSAASAPVRVEREVRLMGTRVLLKGDFENRETGVLQLEGLIRQLESTEAELSTWRSDSFLSRLNRHPLDAWLQLEPPTCDLFQILFQWTARTGSAFDPAVGRLIEAWDLRGAGRVPSAEALREAIGNSGLESGFRFEEARCRIARRRPVLLDAGAFGKGEGLERARSWADRRGLSNWLIDLGGQLAVSGKPATEPAWTVGIAHPLHRQRTLFEVVLEKGSLATSGGSERDLLEDGRRIPHILDPRRGTGAAFEGSVLVWHENALLADILSTALFVMGVEEGLPWAEAHQIAVCYLVPSRSGGEVEVLLRPTSWFGAIFPGLPRLPSLP